MDFGNINSVFSSFSYDNAVLGIPLPMLHTFTATAIKNTLLAISPDIKLHHTTRIYIVLNSISKEKSDFSGFMMFILENHIVRLEKFTLISTETKQNY